MSLLNTAYPFSLTKWIVGNFLWLLLLITACHSGEVKPGFRGECGLFSSQLDWSQRIKILNLLSLAFTQGCDEVFIRYAQLAQEDFRHKRFSFSRETASVFLSDGAITEYVLESYERAYLSVLLAASYIRTRQPQEAKVELRNLDHELFASLYNFGEDPVNIILSAVLWEVVGEPEEARIDWLRIAEPFRSTLVSVDSSLRNYARNQIARLDQGNRKVSSWQVLGVGRFPQIDWKFEFFGSQNGYFAIKPQSPFLSVCVSETGVRVPTESWFSKIAHRHDQAYHPLLNLQSWLRLPVGILYGLVPFSVGAGVAVGGCAGAATLGGRGSGNLCALSILGGIHLMEETPTVFQNTVRPDLRHWDLIPAGFVLTQATSLEEEPCSTAQARVHNLVSPL